MNHTIVQDIRFSLTVVHQKWPDLRFKLKHVRWVSTTPTQPNPSCLTNLHKYHASGILSRIRRDGVKESLKCVIIERESISMLRNRQ